MAFLHTTDSIEDMIGFRSKFYVIKTVSKKEDKKVKVMIECLGIPIYQMKNIKTVIKSIPNSDNLYYLLEVLTATCIQYYNIKFS